MIEQMHPRLELEESYQEDVLPSRKQAAFAVVVVAAAEKKTRMR